MPRTKSMGRAANGNGTIRKKSVMKNGKKYTYYEARATVGYDLGTGKQIQRSVTGKTQKEVRQKLSQIVVDLDEGTYIQPSKETVGAWLDTWVDTYVVPNVKPYTADAIKGAYFKDEFRTVLFVEDLDLCYRYYTEVLELPCVYQWDEGPGDRGFKYKAAGSGAYIETLHRVPLTEQGAGTIKIEARDIDACYAALQKKPDANITKALAPTGWGTRQFELTDPDSNIILVFSRQ